MWIAYSSNETAHYTDGERNLRGAYVCACGYDMLPELCKQSDSHKCKNCLRKKAKLERVEFDVSWKTSWGL